MNPSLRILLAATALGAGAASAQNAAPPPEYPNIPPGERAPTPSPAPSDRRADAPPAERGGGPQTGEPPRPPDAPRDGFQPRDGFHHGPREFRGEHRHFSYEGPRDDRERRSQGEESRGRGEMGPRPPMPQGEFGHGPQAGGPRFPGAPHERFYNETRVYRERPSHDGESRGPGEMGQRPPMPQGEYDRGPQAGGPRFPGASHDRFYNETRVYRDRPSYDGARHRPGEMGPRPPMPQGDRFAYGMRTPSGPPFHRDDRYRAEARYGAPRPGGGPDEMAQPPMRDDRRFGPGDGPQEFRRPPMPPQQFGAPGARDDRRAFDGPMDGRPRFDHAPPPHDAHFQPGGPRSEGDARPDQSHGRPPGPPPPPFQ